MLHLRFMNTSLPPQVFYLPAWLVSLRANALFQALETEAGWKQEHIRIQGNTIALPRLTAWHGDRGYRYSGIENTPLPWTPSLVLLRDQLMAHTGATFNSVLCNFYRSGQDSVAWHADDERELGAQPVIASLSLGGARKFSFKRKDGVGARIDLNLEHGDLLIMQGDTQKEWVHQIPKTKQPTSPRINLTFRFIHG